MGISFGLFPQIHLDLNFDSFKLLFMCNILLHNMFLNKHSIYKKQATGVSILVDIVKFKANIIC